MGNSEWGSDLNMIRYKIRMWWWRLPPRIKLFLFLGPQLLLIIWFVTRTPGDINRSSDSPLHGMPKLFNWVREGGLEMPNIEIVMTKKGKTMITLEDIPAGDVFRVPYSLLLCGYLNEKEGVADDPAWKLIADLDFNTHWSEALLMLVQKQQGSNAWFAPYLETITTREQLSMPVFWEDPKEINAIEGKALRKWLVDDTREELDNYWPTVDRLVKNNPDILDPKVFTYRNFEWASASIWSRAFNTYLGDDMFATAVPVVDLMNHDNTFNTWWELDDENGYWVLKTSTPMKAGDEVRITYGDMPNIRLLKWFGFAIDGNTDDAYYFDVILPSTEDPNYTKKQNFLRQVGADWIEIMENRFPSKLLACARVAVLSEDDFDPDILRNTERKSKDRPFAKINCNNELAALEFLAGEVNKLLAEFTTTVAEDDALLATDLTLNMKHAVIIRKGHKIILSGLKKKILERLEEEKRKCQ